MARPTVTRALLTERVHQELGLSRRASAQLVDDVLEEVAQTLVDGGSVKISKFGSFKLRHKRERIGRNPKTGVDAPISARKVLMFRASRTFRHDVERRLAAWDGGEPDRAAAPAPGMQDPV